MGGLLKTYLWSVFRCKIGLQWPKNATGPKLRCKSGLHWAALVGLLRNYPTPGQKWDVRRSYIGWQLEDYCAFTPANISAKYLAAIVFNRSFEKKSLTKFPMQEWAAMCFNGRNIGELYPGQNSDLRLGCNGLL